MQSVVEQQIKKLPEGGWIKQKGNEPILSIQNRLKNEFSELFDLASLNNLEIARVLPTHQSLSTETSLINVINSASQEFAISTTAFNFFFNNEDIFSDALKRGISIKILLIDPETQAEGEMNYHFFYDTDKAKESNNRSKSLSDLNSVVDRIRPMILRKQEEHWPGEMEIRFRRKPNYFQMWLTDRNDQNGIAQMNSVNFMTGFQPHFRFTKPAAERLFELINKEFDTYWNDPDNLNLSQFIERRASKDL